MTQAAVRLDATPILLSLFDRDFSPEGLSAVLGADADIPARLWDKALAAPLRSLAARGGKELRGRLVGIAWEMAGGKGALPADLHGIVEGLHLGSLIVDDIEDGSSRRRGGPSLHRTVGLPLALNAGNWLYFWPTLLIGRLDLPPATELQLRRAVDEAVLRCHFGQGLDLSVRVNDLQRSEVGSVVMSTTRLKTGSLMELSARVGALAAGADDNCVRTIGRLGSDLGIALQMLDDLTGLTSEQRCHKGHEDLLHARPTWPWAWAAECADAPTYEALRGLGEEVTARDHHPELLAAALRHWVAAPGREAIRRHLAASLAAVARGIGERRGFARLKQWVKELEHYE